jgi:hypothetical protein
MKNLTINSSINFGGFYNSIHSDIIDTYIEDYEYDWEKVNYISTYENYSKDYIKVLNNILDTNISFKALNSPRFYNYSTDVISIEISKKDALKLFQYVRNEELKQEVFEIIKDSSTSKDGYIAFYEYKDFFKKDNLNILLECMLDVIVDNLQNDIIEELQSNYLEIVLNNDN